MNVRTLLITLLISLTLVGCPSKVTAPHKLDLEESTIGFRSISVTEPSMLYGMDTLAGARYPKQVLQKVPQGWALGFFWNTFGEVKNLLEKVGTKGKWPYVRVQGVWKDDHVFGSAERSKAIQIAKEYSKIATRFPNITWAYSPFCEHRKNQAYMRSLFQELHAIAPNLELVNTPIAGGDFVYNLPYLVNEWHHSNPAPTQGKKNFSYDGVHAADSNIEDVRTKALNLKARVFFFWVLQFNQKKNRSDTTPRPLRKVKPNKEMIEAVAYWKTPRSIDTLSKSWQYKSWSEQHLDVDPRANKPVILGPSSGTVYAKSSTGQYSFTPSGVDPHSGDYVFRLLNKYGYQIGGVERKVKVFVNGQSIGQIDSGYRSSKRYIEQ